MVPRRSYFTVFVFSFKLTETNYLFYFFYRKVKKIKKLGKTVVQLHTPEDGRVEIHPKSVNSKALGFESKFLVYHMKLKSTKINLHDTSMIHPLPLIFFGHSINSYEENSRTIIELSDAVRFSMSEEAARLIMVICVI